MRVRLSCFLITCLPLRNDRDDFKNADLAMTTYISTVNADESR